MNTIFVEDVEGAENYCFVKVDIAFNAFAAGMTIQWTKVTSSPVTELRKMYGIDGASGPITELRHSVQHFIDAFKNFAIAVWVLPLQLSGAIPVEIGKTLLDVLDNALE